VGLPVHRAGANPRFRSIYNKPRFGFNQSVVCLCAYVFVFRVYMHEKPHLTLYRGWGILLGGAVRVSGWMCIEVLLPHCIR